MPPWDTRLRIALDRTVSLVSRPDLTKVDLANEREQERRNGASGARLSPVVGLKLAGEDGPVVEALEPVLTDSNSSQAQ
jgi:hypothetical protein